MTTKKPTITTTGYFRTELTFYMPDGRLYIIGGQTETPEQKALFHKLAAVDDLIETLQDALDEHDAHERGERALDLWVHPARAALAKARGEA
jgi:hypothetical protein